MDIFKKIASLFTHNQAIVTEGSGVLTVAEEVVTTPQTPAAIVHEGAQLVNTFDPAIIAQLDGVLEASLTKLGIPEQGIKSVEADLNAWLESAGIAKPVTP